MHIDHVCRVRACCRPLFGVHLEMVTPQENNRRALEYRQKGPEDPCHNGARLWCRSGHELTPENTGYEVKRKRRYCKKCHRIALVRLRRHDQGQKPPGEQWHVDAAVFDSLADQYPLVPGEPTLTTKEVAELIGMPPVALSEWRKRNRSMDTPLGPKGRGKPLAWPQSHVLRLIAAKSDENWAKPRKGGHVVGRTGWVTDAETGQRRMSRKVADDGRMPGSRPYTSSTQDSGSRFRVRVVRLGEDSDPIESVCPCRLVSLSSTRQWLSVWRGSVP